MMKKFFTFKFNRSLAETELVEIQGTIINGTAPASLLVQFKEKLGRLSVHEALQECIEDIKREQKKQKLRLVRVGYLCTTCLLVVFGLFFSLAKSKNRRAAKSLDKRVEHVSSPPLLISKEVHLKEHIPVPALLPEQLNFCGEVVPMEDHAISKRMKKVLGQTRFSRMQSAHLQHKIKKWFPLITPILKHYHIPDDFKYIPLVETGFANAVSSQGAGGFWQLMEGTARHYGLKVTDSIDERLDVIRCTGAACRYIRDLHRELGSWTLTAAAYNMGLGGLQHKVNGQNNRDYYRLQLNAETSHYVYKTLAFKQRLTSRKRKMTPYAG